MRVMGPLQWNEADMKAAIDTKAMTALRSEMYFYQNPDIPERRKHEQASLLHTSETRSWTTELADTLRGFKSRCLEMIGTS